MSEVKRIVIDAEKCIRCGACSRDCITSKIAYNPGEVPVVQAGVHCIKCGHCATSCPVQAIAFEGKKLEKFEGKLPDPADLDRLIRFRRSTREYSSKPVDIELLKSICETVSIGSPSAGNCRRVGFTIVGGDRVQQVSDMTIDIMEKSGNPIFEGMCKKYKMKTNVITYDAPNLVVLWSDKVKGGLGLESPVMASLDIGISAESFDLLAAAHGLGCCYIGFIISTVGQSPDGRKLLGVPDDCTPYVCFTVGYPATPPQSLCPRHPKKIIVVE